MRFDDRLHEAIADADEARVRRLLAGAGRAKLAELALTRGLPDWVAALVQEEKRRRGRAEQDPLAAAIACPTKMRLRTLPDRRDEYTYLPLDDLRGLLPAGAQEEVTQAWPDADGGSIAAVYRWVLRGLPPELACRKVRLSRPGPRARRPPDAVARAASRWGPPLRRDECSVAAGRESEAPDVPAWLGPLVEAVGGSLADHAAAGSLGIRWREGRVQWEVLAYPLPGGPAFGTHSGGGFSLDLGRLQSAFGRVDRLGWDARGGVFGGGGPCVWVEGLHADREVLLRVLAHAPADEYPGESESDAAVGQ
jgi:hypothetical protein